MQCNDHYPHGGKKKVQGKSPADSAQEKQEAFPEDKVFVQVLLQLMEEHGGSTDI